MSLPLPAVLRTIHAVANNTTMAATLRTKASVLVDTSPLLCEDSLAFTDLVYSIKNPIFHLPFFMTYGRFKVLVQQMAEYTHCSYYEALLPTVPMEQSERLRQLDFLPNTDWDLSNMLVASISMTTKEILSLPITGNQQVSSMDHMISHKNQRSEINITYREYTFASVTSEHERTNLLRVIASEWSGLSVRSALMISSPTFPLTIIPGIGTYHVLVQTCESRDYEVKID